MNSILDIFPCELGEPMLIPGPERLEGAEENSDLPALGKRSAASPLDQAAEDWADIT